MSDGGALIHRKFQLDKLDHDIEVAQAKRARLLEEIQQEAFAGCDLVLLGQFNTIDFCLYRRVSNGPNSGWIRSGTVGSNQRHFADGYQNDAALIEDAKGADLIIIPIKTGQVIYPS